MKKMISLVMAVVMMLSMMSTTAFAESRVEYAPYGFSWHDDDANVWHVQMYEFDSKASAYRVSDRVVVKDSVLYDMAGVVIANDVATFTEEKPTVGYDAEANLYFISKSGEIRRMSNSLDNYYSATQVITGQSFICDYEGLVKQVNAQDGKQFDAISLPYTGRYMRHEDPSVTKGQVRMYAVNGDPEKIGYDALYNSKVIVSAFAKENRVWVETVKRLITENCKGAKFVGFTAQYGILLNDLNGNILWFQYEDGFKNATILLKELEVYYFQKTPEGFLSGIVTNKGTYAVNTTLKVPGNASNTGSNSSTGNTGTSTGSNGTVTSVKNFQSKSMAYQGDTYLGMLSLKNKKLSWKGTELAYSEGSADFGISQSMTPYWINGDDNLYYFNGSESQLISKNAIRLKFDDNGRVTQYKAADGNWYNLG